MEHPSNSRSEFLQCSSSMVQRFPHDAPDSYGTHSVHWKPHHRCLIARRRRLECRDQRALRTTAFLTQFHSLAERDPLCRRGRSRHPSRGLARAQAAGSL